MFFVPENGKDENKKDNFIVDEAEEEDEEEAYVTKKGKAKKEKHQKRFLLLSFKQDIPYDAQQTKLPCPQPCSERKRAI